MAKIHPHLSSSSSPSRRSWSEHNNKELEKFTVWMKSLVLNGNGCTIYDAKGNIVYRIDNYDTKCSSQVYLMDLKGKVLSTLLRKKLRVKEQWSGYRNDRSKKEKPWFQVKKTTKLFNKKDGFSCQVTMGGDNNCEALSCFKIQGSCHKNSEYKIIRGDGFVVAQVKRKQSKGVLLGDDVLSLEMDPNLDHSFIISLVVIHGLMSHKI